GENQPLGGYERADARPAGREARGDLCQTRRDEGQTGRGTGTVAGSARAVPPAIAHGLQSGAYCSLSCPDRGPTKKNPRHCRGFSFRLSGASPYRPPRLAILACRSAIASCTVSPPPTMVEP